MYVPSTVADSASPSSDDEVLPDRSADDTDTGWGDEPEPDSDEETRRYVEDRPPHWEP